MRVVARAPGRVNLIGDHTDYTGGLVLPMAVDRWTTVEGERGGDTVSLTSADAEGTVVVPLNVTDPASVEPGWARYVAGVVATIRPSRGFTGRVTTTLPVGAGLSSSAALEVAVALALGFEGTPLALARACRTAEQAASGVPCGIMDQLASAAGVSGHALLIDCAEESVTPVPLPLDAMVVVAHSGVARTLVSSAYAERRAQCGAAEAVIGPLRQASLGDVARIDDPTVAARARHVVTENARVVAFSAALRAGDLRAAGRLMVESHRSLAEQFEVSTPALDALVDRLLATPGVHGARLTGAGFGGCAVALCDAGVDVDGWPVTAVDGANLSAS